MSAMAGGYDNSTTGYFSEPVMVNNISSSVDGGNVSETNVTSNFTAPPDSQYILWQQVLICLILGVLTIGTAIGNSLVCIAVAIVRRLRTPSNLLIVSLAVSDLFVALLVMPFATAYEIMGYWTFGGVICDMWTSLDVMLCTASILNLCVISVDRYFVITRPFQYAPKRTLRRMALYIAGVWLASALISIPPLFGWKTQREEWACSISQAISYQIYATLGAFYLPLTVMIVVYYKIWRVSSKIAKVEAKSKMGSIDRGQEQLNLSCKSSRSSGDSQYLPNGTLRNGGTEKDNEAVLDSLGHKVQTKHRRFTAWKSILPKSHKVSSSGERKATKTLGIIMGGFTACWLPFFILAVVRPFCDPKEIYCDIPPWLSSILLWLGYFNSFLNPVIYARFNRDFRTPFKEILLFRCRGINRRLRSESYAEQYGGPSPCQRDSLRPPTDTVVRYNSHGQTFVQVGNGSAALDPKESTI